MIWAVWKESLGFMSWQSIEDFYTPMAPLLKKNRLHKRRLELKILWFSLTFQLDWTNTVDYVHLVPRRKSTIADWDPFLLRIINSHSRSLWRKWYSRFLGSEKMTTCRWYDRFHHSRNRLLTALPIYWCLIHRWEGLTLHSIGKHILSLKRWR